MQREKRTPRFKRVTPPSFQLTERDVAVLRAVHTHRLLNSDQIERLIGGSGQQLRRRLKLLFNAGCLDRPRVQVTQLFAQPGTVPMVYGLGSKGAALLAERGLAERPRADWSAKNRALRYRFLEHTLMIAEIMVSVAESARAHVGVRVISFGEILKTTAPQKTREMQHPQTWRMALPKVGPVGLTPDKIFGLEFADREPGRNRVYFFVEADRGTMPVERTNLKQTSFLKKMRVYHETYRRKLHTERFGFKNFRVLTATTSRERVQSMVRACQKLQGLQGLFLFADTGRVGSNDVLSMEWVDGRGELSAIMT